MTGCTAVNWRGAAASAVVVFLSSVGMSVNAQTKLEVSDPIAAIDGQPILLGELNLVLADRFGRNQLDRIPQHVKQAAAVLLVRRHLAMRSLQRLGGESLEAQLQRTVDEASTNARRHGDSLANLASDRQADERCLIAELRWHSAWAHYLQSRMTNENLQRFYALNPLKYGGGRWNVSHLFLATADSPEADETNVQHSISELANQLTQSQSLSDDFAQLARRYSDSGSAQQGGALGWVQKQGDLPKPVMDLIRATPPGKVGGPVRSPLGWHLVLVHQVDAKGCSFGEVTDQSQLRRDAAGALFHSLVTRQADTTVTWFDTLFRPPASVEVIPNRSSTQRNVNH